MSSSPQEEVTSQMGRSFPPQVGCEPLPQEEAAHLRRLRAPFSPGGSCALWEL